ncbi:MAG: hypothetical protein DI562_02045 [Stenotrophomonas acidaminiphila]|nr:MAG: hypothetical protein DI562_02045 [Stenotrophomonas acidaminiphila]
MARNWKFWVLIGAILGAGWIANASFHNAIDDAVKEAITPLSAEMKTGFEKSDKRFDQLDARFDKVDARLDAVDKSVNEHNATLARLDERTRDRPARHGVLGAAA